MELSEAQYKTVLRYFYFLLMDESQVLSATFKALKQISILKRKNPETDISIAIIRALHKSFKKLKIKSAQSRSASPHREWPFSDRSALLNWKELLKLGQTEYTEALVLRYVTGFTPEEIATALDMPVGTVIFRLNKGLAILASLTAEQVHG